MESQMEENLNKRASEKFDQWIRSWQNDWSPFNGIGNIMPPPEPGEVSGVNKAVCDAGRVALFLAALAGTVGVVIDGMHPQPAYADSSGDGGDGTVMHGWVESNGCPELGLEVCHFSPPGPIIKAGPCSGELGCISAIVDLSKAPVDERDEEIFGLSDGDEVCVVSPQVNKIPKLCSPGHLEEVGSPGPDFRPILDGGVLRIVDDQGLEGGQEPKKDALVPGLRQDMQEQVWNDYEQKVKEQRGEQARNTGIIGTASAAGLAALIAGGRKLIKDKLQAGNRQYARQSRRTCKTGRNCRCKP